jgi:hypothetical protein
MGMQPASTINESKIEMRMRFSGRKRDESAATVSPERYDAALAGEIARYFLPFCLP